MYPDLTDYGDAFNYELVQRKVLLNGEQHKILCWVPTSMNERFFAGFLTQEEHVFFDPGKQKVFACRVASMKQRHSMAETMRSISLSITITGGGTTLICRKCRSRSPIRVS